MPELVKIDLAKAHIVNGNEFPVAYSLETQGGKSTTEDIAAFLRAEAEKDVFNKLLSKHGAVVIRNTGTTDPEILSDYIQAIAAGSGTEPFVQNGLTANRTEITETLSTANEGPPELLIPQHNEFSRFKKFPTTLFFTCTKYDAKGGETPIVHGAEFFNSLYSEAPDFVKQLSQKSLYMGQIWPNHSTTNTSWKDFFCFGRYINEDDDFNTKRKKAEELVVDRISNHYDWVGDDGNDLHIHQKQVPTRVYNDKFSEREYPTLFNSLAAYYYQIKENSFVTATSGINFDDGTEIKKEWLDLFLKLSLDLSYDHQWQEGDIAIVNNQQVSHGRLPWSDGTRTILVSMWGRDDVDYKVWKP